MGKLKIATLLLAFAILSSHLAVALTPYFTQSYAVEENLPEMTLNVDPSLVKHGAIIRLHDENGEFFCSGFVVSNEYAVTAGHCVDETIGMKSNIKIYNSNMEDTGVTAKGAASNRRGDTALILGDFKAFARIKVGLTPEEQFNDLAEGFAKQIMTIQYKACGYPYGDELFCSPVIFQGTHTFFLSGEGFMYPGMSGGPLLNAQGAAVGINSHATETGLGWASLIGLIKGFNIKIKK